jgi:hypothetical protein
MQERTETTLERIEVAYNPDNPCFGLYGKPFPMKQHPNQQCGLDVYVKVINFETGEWCQKKLYKNDKGLHFKHTGYSPMYIDDFIEKASVVPFQVFLKGEKP